MGKLKKILLAVVLTLIGLSSVQGASFVSHFSDLVAYPHFSNRHLFDAGKRHLKVLLTCYWAHGSDTDYWSRHKESSTGERLQSGVSAAVDPRIIPYYSKIKIPDGPTLIAHDTGTDVVNRKASHHRLPIVDIFFNTEREARLFAENTPEIVTVTILN
jgi:3D (Asp-Asp-Asp) domain-containing protein